MNTSVMKSLDRTMESSQSSNMVIIYKIEGKPNFYLDGERERTINKGY